MIPTFLSAFVRVIVIMSITGGLLCLLMLALKPLIRHRLPKLAQYCFWLVVLGALLIPISRIVILPDAAPNISPIHNVIEQNVVSVAEETERFYREQDDRLRYLMFATADSLAQIIPYRHMVTATPPRPSLWAIVSTIFMLVYPFVAVLVLATA